MGDVARGAWHYVLLLLAACVWGALHYIPVACTAALLARFLAAMGSVICTSLLAVKGPS